MLMGAKSCMSITFKIKLILYAKQGVIQRTQLIRMSPFFVYVANSENFNLDKLPQRLMYPRTKSELKTFDLVLKSNHFYIISSF